MSGIWLDTNILLPWKLHLNTAQAEKFLTVCEGWGHEILVPEVVLSELAHHYAREAQGELHAINRSKGKLTSLEIEVAEESWARPPDDLADHYRKILAHRCHEKSIIIVPAVDVSVHRLFDMSVKRVPPFEEPKGERGFHDTLILFSVLEHAREKQLPDAILISDDNIFQNERALALAEEYGVQVDVYKSIDDFVTHESALLEEEYKTFVQDREMRARSFLLGHKGDIERFIVQKASFGERFLAGDFFTGTIKDIIGFKLTDITGVTVLGAKKEADFRFITFTARLDILLDTEVSPYSGLWGMGAKRYRVGQEPEEQPVSLPASGRKTISVSRDVVCEATAIEHAETFSELKLKEVKAEALGDLVGTLMAALDPSVTSE